MNKKERERLERMIIEKKKEVRRCGEKEREIYDGGRSVSMTMRTNKANNGVPRIA